MTQQNPLLVTFEGGRTGEWIVEEIRAITGPSLPKVDRVALWEGDDTPPRLSEPRWKLQGVVTSYERYVRRREHDALVLKQPPLGRLEATRASLIPIHKSEQWWELSQDRRREIFEERSHHISVGMDYLPAIARRLVHCRDLGGPFDFLTWFEYSPVDSPKFEELVRKLRQTEEWEYVDREVEIRLRKVV